MVDIDVLKAKFLRAYANLPEPEGEQVVVIMNDKEYSWNKVHSEVLDNTELGNLLLKRLNKIGIL